MKVSRQQRQDLASHIPAIAERGVFADTYHFADGSVRLVAIDRHGILVAEARVYTRAAFDFAERRLWRELEEADPIPRLRLL